MAQGMVDPAIFEGLQSKIDDDKVFRDVCLSPKFWSLRMLIVDCRAFAILSRSLRSKVVDTARYVCIYGMVDE